MCCLTRNASVCLVTLLIQFQTLNADTIRVPDDHRTIQGAIDASTAGDTVLVNPGNYKERIQLKAGVKLVSAGDDAKGALGLKRAESTIIDGGGRHGTAAGVTMAPDSTLDGFTVTNVGIYDNDQWNKHHDSQGEHQSHEHIGQPGTPGIGVIGVTCTIKNNIVHHIGYTGIAIQGIKGKNCSPLVLKNICYRNMGGGIGSMLKSTAVIEQNRCFQNFYAGIGHDDASPTVINNICYENIRAGIGISEGACPVVRSNQCYRNRRAGIGTRTGTGTRPIIEDNDCFENEMAGIGTEEQAAPVIRNNRCYRNKLAGIGSRTQATPIIVGNQCHENGAAGIGQESDAATVLIGNHSHHNQAAGIGFAACKAGQSTVINNQVIDNALVAIGVNSGWSVTLSGNQMSRAGGMPPIVMVSQGANATFTDNSIRGGGVAGIRVAGTVRVDNNEFIGTSLRKAGPPNFAVWGLPGSQVTMTSNNITGWRHGLHATEASNIQIVKNRVSDFHRAAIVIEKPGSPVVVYGNTAVSVDTKTRVVSIDGEGGVVRDNELVKPLPSE